MKGSPHETIYIYILIFVILLYWPLEKFTLHLSLPHPLPLSVCHTSEYEKQYINSWQRNEYKVLRPKESNAKVLRRLKQLIHWCQTKYLILNNPWPCIKLIHHGDEINKCIQTFNSILYYIIYIVYLLHVSAALVGHPQGDALQWTYYKTFWPKAQMNDIKF